MMEANEIKKLLYKEKPLAKWVLTCDGVERYTAETSIGTIRFNIPLSEASTFGREEPAQLLIRWMNANQIEQNEQEN